MASYQENRELSLIATTDLAGKEGYAVAFDANTAGQVVLANAQTLPIVGILSVANKAGYTNSRVTVIAAQNGTAKAVYGGTVHVGDNLTADTGGKLIATTTNKDIVIALAKEAGSANEIHEVILGRFTLSS